MKIAIDASLVGGRNTGDTSYWNGLLHGLSQTDTSATFLLFYNAQRPIPIPNDPRFVACPVAAPSSRWWSLVSFPLAARQSGADLAHSQYNLSPLIRRGVTTIHDVSFFIGPEWFRPRDRWIMTRFLPGTCHRASAILTVSETSRGEIERFLPTARGKVRVTYNALSPTFPTQPLSPPNVERPYLLTVGTRWPRKNMQLAIEAIERLSTPHRLVVTGQPGWGSEQISDRVVATGYVPEEELAALYQHAALYLAPSRHEGFGIPLLEAWASGCPVLCSGAAAFQEVGGDAVAIEPSWEPGVWSDRIERLLQDEPARRHLSDCGRRRLERYDWRDTAMKTVETYREAMAHG